MQATSRSPGKSGEVISARSWTSNRVSCRSPSRTSALTCGARSAVIQSSPAGRDILAQPRGGQHAPVPDQHHLVDPEPVLDLGHLGGHGRRVAGVAFEDLDGDRDAVPAGQEPVDDLQPALHPVFGVADGAQRAGPALERGGGDVIQHQGAAAQVPGGQRALDLSCRPCR